MFFSLPAKEKNEKKRGCVREVVVTLELPRFSSSGNLRCLGAHIFTSCCGGTGEKLFRSDSRRGSHILWHGYGFGLSQYDNCDAELDE